MELAPHNDIDPVFPRRKKLPHDIPDWIKDDAIFFITVQCDGTHNQLARNDVAEAVKESLSHRQVLGQWWVHFFLLMPDHLHGLVTFSCEHAMRRVVQDWKRFLACEKGIQWQCDFFDHRIRTMDELHEKWYYIRNNPVRKNLVASPDDWPYQWQNGVSR